MKKIYLLALIALVLPTEGKRMRRRRTTKISLSNSWPYLAFFGAGFGLLAWDKYRAWRKQKDDGLDDGLDGLESLRGRLERLNDHPRTPQSTTKWEITKEEPQEPEEEEYESDQGVINDIDRKLEEEKQLNENISVRRYSSEDEEDPLPPIKSMEQESLQKSSGSPSFAVLKNIQKILEAYAREKSRKNESIYKEKIKESLKKEHPDMGEKELEEKSVLLISDSFYGNFWGKKKPLHDKKRVQNIIYNGSLFTLDLGAKEEEFDQALRLELKRAKTPLDYSCIYGILSSYSDGHPEYTKIRKFKNRMRAKIILPHDPIQRLLDWVDERENHSTLPTVGVHDEFCLKGFHFIAKYLSELKPTDKRITDYYTWGARKALNYLEDTKNGVPNHKELAAKKSSGELLALLRTLEKKLQEAIANVQEPIKALNT